MLPSIKPTRVRWQGAPPGFSALSRRRVSLLPDHKRPPPLSFRLPRRAVGPEFRWACGPPKKMKMARTNIEWVSRWDRFLRRNPGLKIETWAIHSKSEVAA